jgi:formate dehydrogenase iron-sulfur subunit
MGQTVGFFTDTTLCIGCKACEVACKEWNQLPNNPLEFRDSYDNTGQLDHQNWRHVRFIEQTTTNQDKPIAWSMMSDVCKHCANASCLEVCPTNAIIRTEFDTVFIQQDVCNGCRDCISACPYGVIGFNSNTGTAQKCTFCYDRLQNNLKPACATACPTQSIKFGPLDELRQTAAARLSTLQAQGVSQARIYGDKEYGGLHAFFLLTDKPEAYALPSAESAVLPGRNNFPGYLTAAITAILAGLGGLIAFRRRGEPPAASSPSPAAGTGGSSPSPARGGGQGGGP